MSRDRERSDRRRKPQKARPGGIAVTVLCCVMGVPTGAYILPGIAVAEPMAALQAGALLALAYLLLRPLLKIVTLPLGCLTLGLSNCAVDVGLLYACSYLIEGFSVESVVSALALAVLINSISAIAGGFK